MLRVRPYTLVVSFLFVGLPLLLLASLFLGYESVSVNHLWSAIRGQWLEQLPVSMLHYLALPRFVVAIAGGVGMAVAGCLLQQTLQNDFASPATLGINVGAMVAVLIVGVVAADVLVHWSVLIAFLGAVFTSALVYFIARAISPAPINLILVGMAISLALGAISAGILMIFEGRLDGFYIWGAGNLSHANMSNAQQLLLFLLLLMVVSLVLAKKLDFFALGDDIATSLGVAVPRLRISAVLLAILMSSIVVSNVGIISFIGLISPHLARAMGANKMSGRILSSAAIGAVLLVAADTFSLLMTRLEYLIPAGALTTLIGAPFMMFLLSQRQRQVGQPSENFDVGITPIFRFSTVKIFCCVYLVIACLLAIIIFGDTPLYIGLPRFLVAGLAGMGLAVSGFILQIILRNPLASPDIAGITSSGVLAVVVVSALFPLTRASMVMVSLVSSALVASFAFFWLRKVAFSPQRWALMGVCLSAFCATGVTVVMSLGATQSSEALLWLSGATYGVSYQEALWLTPIPILTVVLLLGPWRWLSLIQLGLPYASSLGLANGKALLLMGAVVVLFCALCVSVVGGIAFVGLMAPHLVRLMGLTHPRWSLLGAASVGAVLLILADYLAIKLMAPFELPSGLVVSAIGGVYFITLLMSGRYIQKNKA